MLSKSYRRAATIHLRFKYVDIYFPYFDTRLQVSGSACTISFPVMLAFFKNIPQLLAFLKLNMYVDQDISINIDYPYLKKPFLS